MCHIKEASLWTIEQDKLAWTLKTICRSPRVIYRWDFAYFSSGLVNFLNKKYFALELFCLFLIYPRLGNATQHMLYSATSCRIMNVDQTDLFNDETKLSGSSWRYIYFEFGSTHCELPKKIPFSSYSVLL